MRWRHGGMAGRNDRAVYGSLSRLGSGSEMICITPDPSLSFLTSQDEENSADPIFEFNCEQQR